jgi:hypothetical protein
LPASQPESQQPALEAGFVLPPDDPHAGLGGSYLINPKTGVRELIERTGHHTEQESLDHGDPA